MEVAYTTDIVDAFRIGIDPIPDWFMDKVSSGDAMLYGDAFGHTSAEINVRDRTNKDYAEYGHYICRSRWCGRIWDLKPEHFAKYYTKIYVE